MTEPALPSTYRKRRPKCGRADCFDPVKRTIVTGDKDGSAPFAWDDDFCSYHAFERDHTIIRVAASSASQR